MSRDSDIKAIKEAVQRLVRDMERRRGYICQYCGHRSLAPKGGNCPNNPEGVHIYTKASVDE